MLLHPAETDFLAGVRGGINTGEEPPSPSFVEYIESDLASPLWGAQREIAESVALHRRTAVRSCHGAGKSYSASRIATAFLQTIENSVVITTAPTNRQVETVLWGYIRDTAQRAIVPLKGKRGHPLTKKWEITPAWYAMGFKAADTNPDAFQGFHAPNILIIVDEAAGVSETLYQSVNALMTGSGARLLLIGNPTSMQGTFREAFHRQREQWHTITISAEDTPNFTHFGVTRQDVEDGTWRQKVGNQPMPYEGLIDPQYAADAIASEGPESPSVRSRIWAEFPRGGSHTLISLSDLEATEQVDDLNTQGEMIGGIDVARFGDDESAIHIRRGEESIDWFAWQGLDTTELTGEIIHWLDARGILPEDITLRVDATGLGAGLADRLREAGYRAVDVLFGAASSDSEQWQNLRHELWWQLGQRFEDHRIGTTGMWGSKLTSQLSDIQYSYRNPKYTKPQIESKDDTKKRTGRSPDHAEAMVLAYANLPVVPKKRLGRKSLAGAVGRSGVFKQP